MIQLSQPSVATVVTDDLTRNFYFHS